MLLCFYIAHLLEYMLIKCINYFLIAVTKYLTKSTFRRKGLFWPTVQRITVPHCQGRQQEHEAADHIESGVWKEIDMNADTYLAFSIFLLSSSDPSP